MGNIQQLSEMIRKFLKIKAVKIGLLILTAVFLCLGAFECWLNWKVRQDLRGALGWGSDARVRIVAHLNWLSLADVFQGRVGHVRVDAQNCLISNLRFTRLHLVNDGFTFNYPRLVQEHRLDLIHLGRTRIQALITASDFSEYANLFYPQFKPRISFLSGAVVFSGEARIFGKTLPVRLTGLMKIHSSQKLGFYPTNLEISGHAAPAELLKFVATKLPLELDLMKEWPLALTAMTLEKDALKISFQEMKSRN